MPLARTESATTTPTGMTTPNASSWQQQQEGQAAQQGQPQTQAQGSPPEAARGPQAVLGSSSEETVARGGSDATANPSASAPLSRAQGQQPVGQQDALQNK